MSCNTTAVMIITMVCVEA